MFFYDPFGGNLIGIVWKPQAFEKKDFKVNRFALLIQLLIVLLNQVLKYVGHV